MKALVTGSAGMTGSHMVDYLLNLNYKVDGLVRRSSTKNLYRLHDALKNPNFQIIEGDIQDLSFISGLIKNNQYDSVIHFGAQSHVGHSFSCPLETLQINTIGTANIVEAIKLHSPNTKMVHASTSELFGGLDGRAYNEESPMHPRSPYGVSKLGAHWFCKNARESYDLFICNSISFNHECISLLTPVLIRKNNIIDIVPVIDIVPNKKDWNTRVDCRLVQSRDVQDIEIWDKNGWTKIKSFTITKADYENIDHVMHCINATCGSFNATGHHRALDEKEQERRVDHIKPGDKISAATHYPSSESMIISEIEATLMGYLAGDGYVSKDYKHVRFSNNNAKLRDKVSKLWHSITGGKSKHTKDISGFGGTSETIDLTGASYHYKALLRNNLYTIDSKKRVPKSVLNCPSAWQGFMDAYYECDSLRSNITKCSYKYQSIKTNSSVLAQGIIFLITHLTGQEFNINTYIKDKSIIYHINFRSPNVNIGGYHFKKPLNEVTKVIELPHEKFVIDIETHSGTFNCGVGLAHIHNSPRRSPEFVTQKIVQATAAYGNWIERKLGMEHPVLYLGNLNASRDWSHALDIVDGIYKIIQHDKADDFVLASGESHSVREFVEKAFAYINVNLEWRGERINEHAIDCKTGNVVVKVDPKFFRPAEVPVLLGDASRAKRVLQWKPKYSFDDLISDMMYTAIDNYFGAPGYIDETATK